MGYHCATHPPPNKNTRIDDHIVSVARQQKHAVGHACDTSGSSPPATTDILAPRIRSRLGKGGFRIKQMRYADAPRKRKAHAMIVERSRTCEHQKHQRMPEKHAYRFTDPTKPSNHTYGLIQHYGIWFYRDGGKFPSGARPNTSSCREVLNAMEPDHSH